MFTIYTETIQKLIEELGRVKQELVELQIKNINLTSKLEVYEKLERVKTISTEAVETPLKFSSFTSNKNTYDDFFKEYSTTNDATLVEKMFTLEKNPTIVLQDIRNILPPNIDLLAKKFKCVKELKLLRKSIKEVSKWKETDEFYSIKPLSDIVDNYIICYNKEKKTTAFNYVRLALLYYPFDFDIFESKVEKYKYEDFDFKVEKIKNELYDNYFTPKENSKHTIKKNELTIRKGDYLTVSLDELFDYVMNERNKRQTAVRVLNNMLNLGKREIEEIETLRLKINKHIRRKKIEQNEYNQNS